jgi:hypothetical protein
MSETYGAMGNLSWKEMYSVAMDQYSKGITMLIPHAVWYDTQNVTFKPELSHRNPLYRDSLKTFNLFLSRLNSILQKKGRHVADIAVLYPISTLQGEHHLDGPLGYYKGGLEIPQTDYIDVAEWLTNIAGKDFTFIHPEVLDEKCQIINQQLHLGNQNNWENFKVLIIPSCKTISLSNLKKIKTFYDQGGKIIFTSQLPSKSVEFNKDQEIVQLIRNVFPKESGTGDLFQSNNKGGQAYYIPNPDGVKIRKVLEQTGITADVDYPLNENLRYLHKRMGKFDMIYIANIGNSDIKTTLKINQKLAPELWDPHTGSILKAAYRTNNNTTQLDLELTPYHSLFIISNISN